MFLPTLYKQGKRGQLRVWRIEIVDRGYRTHASEAEGVILTSEWTQCRAKGIGAAGRSPEQVALDTARSTWDKKQKSNWYQDPNDVSKGKRFFQVMLAQKYEDHREEIRFPVFSQPKLDGMRCVATAEGLRSRGGNAIYAPRIWAVLERHRLGTMRLDGELYNHALRDDFNQIMSLAKREKADPIRRERANAILQYHVYDLPSWDEPFLSRFRMLAEIVAAIEKECKKAGETCPIVLVPTLAAKNQSELDAYHESYLEEGYEGQMIRKADSPYIGDRTDALLKRKEFQDMEFEIVQILEGKGNYAGMAGKIVCRTPEGVEFRAGLTGGFDVYRSLWQNRASLVGRIATVKFQNWTPGPERKPRFGKLKRVRDSE